MLTTPVPGVNGSGGVDSIVVQPDGQLIAVGGVGRGAAPAFQPGVALARYAADGSLDISFGSAGVATTFLPPRTIPRGIESLRVALAPDGKVVVVGSKTPCDVNAFCLNNLEIVLFRYLHDGSLDPTFGGSGMVVTSIDSFTLATSVVVQPDSRILVSADVAHMTDTGVITSSLFALLRYNSDGTLDPGFGSVLRPGVVFTNFFNFLSRPASDAQSLMLYPDGSIVASGTTAAPSITTDEFSNGIGGGGAGVNVAIVKYRPNGAVDESFDSCAAAATGMKGTVLPFFPGAYRFGTLSDSIVAPGTAGPVQSTDPFVVAATASSLVANPAHGLCGIGQEAGLGDSLLGVARYRADGTVDTNFGVNGKVLINPNLAGRDPLSGDKLIGIGIDTSGELLVLGDATGYLENAVGLSVSLLDTDGQLVNAFGNGGIYTEQVGTRPYLLGDPTPASGYEFSTGMVAGDRLILGGVSLAQVHDRLPSDFVLKQYTLGTPSPPQIACGADVSVETDHGRCSAANVALPTPTIANDCGGVSTRNDAPLVFNAGTTAVTWFLVNGNGGTVGVCQQNVTVVDKEPPTIQCPSAITADAVSAQGTSVSYATPQTVDNCPGSVANCAPQSGSTFPVGTTTATCIASDAAHNTAGCSFAIHVKGVSEQTTDLISLVQQSGIDPGISRALAQKLLNALSAIDKGDTRAACSALRAFSSQCRTVAGLTREQIAQFVGAARRISTVIGCR